MLEGPTSEARSIAVNEAKLVWMIWMRLDQDRLEESLVVLNLALQFRILLRPETWLLVVREDVVEVERVSGRPQNGAAQSALLPMSIVGVRSHWFSRVSCVNLHMPNHPGVEVTSLGEHV